jgi:hypothetical protein
MADRLALNENYNKEMVKAELPKFVARVNAVVSEYMATRFPNLPKEEVVVGGGRKYIKQSVGGGHRSVYGFIRAADGALLKAAGWSAPALNFTRGSIFNEDYVVYPYGVL